MMLLAAALGGCSVWSGEGYEEQTAARIDARLAAGMSLDEFESAFPAARIVAEDGSSRIYLVSETAACVLCKTRAGFRRSADVFARTAHFESGRLVSIEPAPELPP